MWLIKGIAASTLVVTAFATVSALTGSDLKLIAGWFACLAWVAVTKDKLP